MKKLQNVTIKGTKDGLILHLDDNCSYDELKNEISFKLSESSRVQQDNKLITVSVQLGNRFLTDIQMEELKSLIMQKKNFIVQTIQSNVLTKAAFEKMKEEQEITSVSKIIRSGQILQVPGDLLLIGDVNPGGTVMAGGNVFVMGVLKGIAHAGWYGNREAVIAASVMRPSQLRISEYTNRAPDHYSEQENREMQGAYIKEHH